MFDSAVRSWQRLLLGFLSLGLQVGLAAAQDATKYAEEFHHDFRGQPFPDELKVVGTPEGNYVKEEKEGFRVTIPKTWIHPFGGVGCRTNFGIRGDFEVTGAFEILHADEPTKGYGVGVNVRVQKAEPATEGTTLARLLRAGPSQVVFWDRVPGGTGKNTGGGQKCNATLLRLRLKRVGPMLYYQWAPGLAGDDFQDIHVAQDFGADDIKTVRISAVTGREPCDVDVRFLDLRIRHGGLAAAVPAKGAGPVAEPSTSNQASAAPTRSWLALALVVGLALTALFALVLGVSFWLWRRRGNAATPAEATEVIDEPGAALPPIAWACPSCGKNLKAKAEAAGKKIKCPKCGKVVSVPS